MIVGLLKRYNIYEEISMCPMCNLKIEYKKFMVYKKRSWFFVSHKNDFFEHVIIFLLLCDNENIWAWHNILNIVQNKKLVLQEKKVDIAQKMFHVNDNKLIVHKKSISYRQK